MSKFVEDPSGTRIDYQGAPLDSGSLPAFFYFALSGEESLELHPYSQPATLLGESSLRVFSFTIPGHGPGFNKFHAIQYWVDQMEAGEYLLETFFEKTVSAIEWLIEQQIVNPEKMAVGGLSRGAFVATHIAAKQPLIHTVLGFAPLTQLMELKEFSEKPQLERRAKELDLSHLVDQLTHIRNFRFYIGNNDTRVGTDPCYHFIRHLAKKGHEKRARHQHVELFITHSVGHHGHGTAPHIFKEGTTWIKQHLTE